MKLANTFRWYILGAFIYLYKTSFDTVGDKILLEKLHIYETEDKNMKLFEKYVSNRKQFEDANGLMKKLN